jgi:hypothetical protein
MRPPKPDSFSTASEPTTRFHPAKLDLVVPFTTFRQTRAALDEAGRMAPGLNADIRLVKIQVIPYPLQLNETPVYLGFLRQQLDHLRAGTGVRSELYFAREFEPALLDTLSDESVVVLASKRRPWPTRNERLAACLRREGYSVVLVLVRELSPPPCRETAVTRS